MQHLNYQEGAHFPQNLPPYSDKQPYNQQPPPADGLANPTMQTQYQLYYAPYGAVPGQGSVVQFPVHTTFVIPVQPTHEPDYLAYSICTMLFCFLPLGIAALVYSILTRDANRMGNSFEAKQNSRMARNLAHSALGIGIALLIAIILVIVAGSMP
ncbi:PREDICTED: proline-rich transmembrane protein 1-like [Gekko japonicus]|uniref:Proline-rich transmembrane protein 1-like n=1 Tax=Gekko japonicus TaxID=146911 RepID=A0ABM1JSQ6_GEKJA|nr:PREDICTED: proline-rich transmembrane protein 1-like [Gekko japonicus]